ncbi:MAG: hypothetical protein ACFFDE_09195, partial [Promethearchaeota archaeon]
FQCVIGVLNLKCFPLGAGVFSGKEIRIGKKAMLMRQWVSGDFNQMGMLCFIESPVTIHMVNKSHIKVSAYIL